MSWFRRKSDPQEGPKNDPCIDLARQALENPKHDDGKTGSRDEHPAGIPRGVDTDFCYGGDSSQCA
jgi:hypothetical protein